MAIDDNTGTNLVSIKSPFKVLSSYRSNDINEFFGRDAETDLLYNYIKSARNALVFGNSGVGKTSMVHCGLISKLPENDWLILDVIRKNNFLEDLINEFQKQSKSPDKGENEPVTIIKGAFSGHSKSVLIVFDQFEELYISGNESEKIALLDTLKVLFDGEPRSNFLFIIQEEYLHFLSDFENYFPDFFNNRLHLEKITKNKAIQCVEGLCESASIKLTEGFSRIFVDKLAQHQIDIDLAYLQIYLDKVYHLAHEENSGNKNLVFKIEHLEQIGEISDVLSEFLDDLINHASNSEVTLKVLKSFVDETGNKRLVTNDLITEFINSISDPIPPELINETISQLIVNRIVVPHRENNLFELGHEGFAKLIADKITRYERGLVNTTAYIDNCFIEYKKRSYCLSENDLNHIKLFEPGLHLNDEKTAYLQKCKKIVKRKKLNHKIERIIGVAIILTLVFFTIRANTNHDQGFLDANKARLKAQNSVTQSKILEEQAKLALQKAANADSLLQIAILKEDEAKEQTRIANNNFIKAANDARIARNRQAETEKQRITAAKKQTMVEKQFEKAKKELAETTRLSELASAISLANKSIVQRTEPLKIQLALQAYDLYSKNNGYAFTSPIYNALYLAGKDLFGKDFNVLSGHNSTVINQIKLIEEEYYTLGDDGKLIVWENTSDGFQRKIIEKRFHYFFTNGVSKIIESSIDSHNIEYFSVDEKNRRLLSLGMNRFLQINPSTDEVFVIEINKYEGKLLKIFPSESGWDIITNTHYIHLDADDPAQIVSQSYPFGFKILDVIESGSGFYLLREDRLSDFNLSTKKSLDIELNIGTYPTKLAVNQELTTLAVGYASGQIDLFDMENTILIKQVKGHNSSLSSLLFSADNKILISGGFDKVINIWDLENISMEPLQLSDQNTFISALHFNDINNLLMIGEVDGTLKYYNLNNEENIKTLCTVKADPLSEQEWIKFIGNHIDYDPYSCN